MDKDTVILIFPDEGKQHALLVSQSGKLQAFELPEEMAAEAFKDGLADVVGISLDGPTFEAARDELAFRMTQVDLPDLQLRRLMQDAMFRFLMQKDVAHG